MLNRKIIHIDMDCFYAAIEIRDNPELLDKPVAVGGSNERSVLCTCNYVAREFGVHSAMSSKIAKNKCPDLIILPVDMSKYKKVAKIIQEIFYSFTPLVEPLALDEAYLDVSQNKEHNNSATLIAQDIQQKIWHEVGLTASAGVAPNKFLAKIASGWNKPNGLFVIPPNQIDRFIVNLAVEKIFGVGRVTLAKLHNVRIYTCADLQQFTLSWLTQKFGKFGYTLYNQSRGIDLREVEPNRPRKSLSVETTFTNDISSMHEIQDHVLNLHNQLSSRLNEINPKYKIKNQFVKIKFNNFKTKTLEIASTSAQISTFIQLINHIELSQAIRLLGIGVRFVTVENNQREQPELFQI